MLTVKKLLPWQVGLESGERAGIRILLLMYVLSLFSEIYKIKNVLKVIKE